MGCPLSLRRSDVPDHCMMGSQITFHSPLMANFLLCGFSKPSLRKSLRRMYKTANMIYPAVLLAAQFANSVSQTIFNDG